mmetsp:Transcript_40574/g.65832  ORF Transcript_40574/g.65832 Transcript_40574/m.65832 type:complete len:233 (-) Transcript_40574:621-1319(-)
MSRLVLFIVFSAFLASSWAAWPLDCSAFTGTTCSACIDAQMEWHFCKWCQSSRTCVAYNTPRGENLNVTCPAPEGGQGTANIELCSNDANEIVYIYPKYDTAWHAHGSGNANVGWRRPMTKDGSVDSRPLAPMNVDLTLRSDDTVYGKSRIWMAIGHNVASTSGVIDKYPVPTYLVNGDSYYVLYEGTTAQGEHVSYRSPFFFSTGWCRQGYTGIVLGCRKCVNVVWKLRAS